MMKLKVLLPSGVLVDEEAGKVSLEDVDGSLTILPRHADYVTAVAPGVMSFEPESGGERFVAVAEGVMVKAADELLISVRRGVLGDDLAQLRERVEKEFRQRDEHEEQAENALNKIEATFVHRVIELDHERR